MHSILFVFVDACRKKNPQSYILPSGGARHHLSTEHPSLFGDIVSAGCLLEIRDKRKHNTKLSPLDCEYLNFLSSPFLIITYQDGECVLSNSELAREGKLKVLKTSHFVAPVLGDCTVFDLQTSNDGVTKEKNF